MLGHDRENLARGIGGPQDADVLYDPELLGGAVRGWKASRLERIDRDAGSGTAVDTLLFAQRPVGTASPERRFPVSERHGCPVAVRDGGGEAPQP